MTQSSDIQSRTKEHVADLADKARATAQQKLEDETRHATDRAASEVENAADAAHSAAQEFDPGSLQAEAASKVAEQLELAASRIRGADLGQTVSQVSNFARQNPAVFIGAAALAGFAAARFLKARDRTSAQPQSDDPWARSHQTASQSEHDTGVMSDINGGRGHA